MSTGSGSGQGRIIERSVVEPGIELAEGAGVSVVTRVLSLTDASSGDAPPGDRSGWGSS